MWGDGGAWWIIILFLFVFCGWGNNGWGNQGRNGSDSSGDALYQDLSGVLTRADLCQDMNFQDVESGIRGLSQGMCDSFYTMNTNMLNGFSGVNSAVASGFAGVDNALCQLGNNISSNINALNVAQIQNANAIQNEINAGTVANMQNTNAIQNSINANSVANMQNATALQSQLSQCCCDITAQIQDVKYQNATDTCAIQNTIQGTTRDIIDNNNANMRSILDFLVQDKISTLETENQALRLSASQVAQNQYLVNELRPMPVPAYVTCNPWAASIGCHQC